MYPYNIDPNEYVRQALALQTPTAPNGAFLPQMTPAARSYIGPTHQALSDTLKAALAKQASNAGIYVPPPADNTAGLLSPAPSFFRMPSDFSAPVYTASATTPTTAAPSTGLANTAQGTTNAHTSMGNGLGYNDTYSRSNGPVGDTLFATGPYSNGGGAGWSFNDGGPFSAVGGLLSGLFGSNPTSVAEQSANTKTAAEAPAAPTYRLTSNDLMGGLGPQASITGTPLAAPSTYDSQTLNVISPATENYFRLGNEDFNLAGNSDLNSYPDVMNNGPYDNGGGAGGSFGYTGSAPLGPVPDSYPAVSNSRADALLNAARNDPSLQSDAGSSRDFSPATGSYGTSGNYTGGYGPPGGDGGDGSGDSKGGPITKKKLFGNKPNNGDDGWGTLKEGEYVIRPESVKVLPPGLLSALNDIYKSPNPKKTLRGLLG